MLEMKETRPVAPSTVVIRARVHPEPGAVMGKAGSKPAL